MARAFPLPKLADDIYAKFTLAGGVLLCSLEVIYFAISDWPSFFLPSVDAFGHTAIGRDFLNVWMGGRSALADGPAAWFDFPAYNQFLRDFLGRPDLHDYFWSYPPHILLFIWPFGLMPYLAAFVLWIALGFAVFLFAAVASGIERRQLMFISVAPAVTINVFIGQNGFFIAALLIGGLINLDRRPVLAGILFGILSIKPQIGLLLPLLLVLAGRWRVIMSAALTIVLLVVMVACLYGPEIWSAYVAKVLPQQRFLQTHLGGLLFLQVPSAFFAGRLVGLPLGLAWLAQAIVSALALAATIWTFWRRRDPVLSIGLLVTAIFLVSPYTLNYDMVVLAWVVGLLRAREDNEPIDHYLLLAVWCLPIAMMLAGLAYIPVAIVVLPAFAARLLWKLSRATAAVDARHAEPAMSLAATPLPEGAL